ncbi:unnamed protein product, partial [Rangifer tarandus platyrhynchus]
KEKVPCSDRKESTFCITHKRGECFCTPRFIGKNCEKVIYHCRLFTINCLNERWCFNIIGRFRYIYTPGCTRNSCWFVKNTCLLHLYAWYCGAISHDIYQDEVSNPPHFKYVWQLIFTANPVKVYFLFNLFKLVKNLQNTTERLHSHFSLSCIEEGNGNPLQCSSLENPRDGGA